MRIKTEGLHTVGRRLLSAHLLMYPPNFVAPILGLLAGVH